MKKIIIAGVSLEIGGIETSLVTLVNHLAEQGNEITLALEKKQGELLEKIDKRIKIIEYRPSTCKIVPFRKMINLLKRIGFQRKYQNKFDISISYATYSLPDSFMARTASPNSILWVHSNYYILLGKKKENVREFMEQVKAKEFRNIFFVSEEGKKQVLACYPELESKSSICHNLIDGEKIEKLSQEKSTIEKEEVTTFLHVGRHTEEDKKITRIIEAAERLKQEKFSFRILLVGEGRDDVIYQELVKNKQLENVIFFCGAQKNPYPYFKISDALILSSEYEGYPVVYNEAILLEIPIITTEVSDSKKIIENKYGKVVGKSTEGMYQGMKEFLEKGFKIQEKWDVNAYNTDIIQKIQDLTQ